MAPRSLPPPPPPLPSDSDFESSNGLFNGHIKKMGVPVVIVLATVLSVFACNEFQAHRQRIATDKALSKLIAFETDWAADLQIASATSRIALAGPVIRLREREKELEEINVPECLKRSREELLAHVRETISAFTSFMSEEQDTMNVHSFLSQKHLTAYTESKKTCGRR